MSRIEQLIAELCPDGVECQMLVDVAKILYGFPFQSNMFTDDEKYIPLIRIRDIKQGKGSIYFKGSFSSEFIIKRGDMIVGMDGEFNLNKWNDRDSILNQRVCKIESKNENITNNNYLFHLLIPLFKKIESETSGSTVKHLSAKAINNISIPIPPLPIQQEIVRILDTFTDLDAELQAELEARKKQYEHYRNQLLNFEGKEVEWKTLGEVGKVCMCKRVMKHETNSSGEIPFYKIGTFGNEANAYISRELYDEYKKKFSFPSKGDILISASGTIGRRVIYDDKPAYFQDSNIIWLSLTNNMLLNKYLYYIYETIEWPVEGGTIKRLYNDNFKKIKIPIPPLSEQERIVTILDKFEALLNKDLPAEIAARCKQYEYYREKLLTFEPPVS
ncbi:MAG: restriction endonuclease subunit S [Proteiniphilum sp.]|jgi:type I restriction enzyme S subunit